MLRPKRFTAFQTKKDEKVLQLFHKAVLDPSISGSLRTYEAHHSSMRLACRYGPALASVASDIMLGLSPSKSTSRTSEAPSAKLERDAVSRATSGLSWSSEPSSLKGTRLRRIVPGRIHRRVSTVEGRLRYSMIEVKLCVWTLMQGTEHNESFSHRLFWQTIRHREPLFCPDSGRPLGPGHNVNSASSAWKRNLSTMAPA